MKSSDRDTLQTLLQVPIQQLENTVVLDGQLLEKSDGAKKHDAKKLGYVKIPGVVNLSYSRLQNFHACPRKFFLREVVSADAGFSGNVHTAFGSAFGAGVQEVLRSGNLQLGLLAAFASWDVGFSEEDKRSSKNIWTALMGVEKFYNHIYPELQENGYELATYKGKPGIELFYLIWYGDRYNDQGHIDIVLHNKRTNKLVVLELKSTSKVSHPADWQNSEQTLGYSVVLDAMAREVGASAGWEVEYLIYNPSPKLDNPEDGFGFTNYTFTKDSMIKTEYLIGRLMDIKSIELMFEHGYFPKRGNACISWNRVCDYFGRCDELQEQYIHQSLEDIHRESSDEVYESSSKDLLDFEGDYVTLLQAQETQAETEPQPENVTITDNVRSVLDNG